MSYKLSWPALLQKTEEEVSKAEEFYSRDDPMTEIDKVRGTEMAYYEKAEDAIRKLEEGLTPNSKVSPTEPIEVSRSEDEGKARVPSQSPIQGAHDAPPDISEERMSPRARDLYHKFPSHGEEEDKVGTCPRCGSAVVAEGMMPGVCKGCGNSYMDCTCQKKGEEEEVKPIDASSVKDALDEAMTNASNLITGVEGFMEDIEGLDMDDIDDTIEVVNNIFQALKDAKEIGFPSSPDSPKPQTKKPTKPTPFGPEKEPETEPKEKDVPEPEEEKEPEKGEA
jgi:hypothetical protein